MPRHVEQDSRALGMSIPADQLTTLGERRRPVTESELSRLKRDLPEARIERDIVRKPPRMLRRRSCPVRAHEDAASPVSPECIVSGAGCVSKRVCCLANTPLSTRAQENARLEVAIQAAHVRTCQADGPERLQAELRENGFPSWIGCMKRLHKTLGLRASVWICADRTDHEVIKDRLTGLLLVKLADSSQTVYWISTYLERPSSWAAFFWTSTLGLTRMFPSAPILSVMCSIKILNDVPPMRSD